MVVSNEKVHHSVDRVTGQVFDEMLHIWEGGQVFNGDYVQRLKVMDNTDRAVLFGDTKLVGLVRAIEGSYTPESTFNLTSFITSS